MRHTLIAALLCGAAVVGVSAGSSSADGVKRHDHFLQKPNGDLVQVGPHVCDNPNLHEAFHNFHRHVHTGSPTSTGAVTIMRSVFCEPA